MTSYDRHADHDSPYRTGRHIPLPQSRHAPLTQVATSANESRADLTSAYSHEESNMSNGFIGSPSGPLSPSTPYSPGMRSGLMRQSSDKFDKSANGEIQMQNFNEGMPPPPPVGHSWKRIDRWAEDHYEELFDNLCEGCTQNDVNQLEHDLDCTLPQDVRDSLQIHDGQERGGLPTGIIFGMMLLDCEEIVMEWQNWRTVNEEFLAKPTEIPAPQMPSKAFAGASSSTSPPPEQPSTNSKLWRQELLARQDSQPPNAVQKAYSHPAWIPMARDWGGNYLAVDLAPGPAGRWGQVIIFGRDYDCKYVVARSWAHMLAIVADDLASDKVHIDEETGELKLLEFKARQNVEPPYLEILRWRCDQKYGRKPRRRPNSTLQINPAAGPHAGPASAASASSPYGSPGAGVEERGRSPHRLSGKGPAASPRAHISSPLARVAEETPAPIKVHTDADAAAKNGTQENLVDMTTPRGSPRVSQDLLDSSRKGSPTTEKENKEAAQENGEKRNSKPAEAKSPVDEKKGEENKENDEMKTVEI